MKTISMIETAEQACRAVMNTYTPAELPPAGIWHYHQGVFLEGMRRVYEQTGNEEYFNYVKSYIDLLVDEEGNFLFAREELDAVQVGILLFPLYQKTGDKRYMIAAKKLRSLYGSFNKTTEGGFWHKDKYPYQMWLDGLYMAGPFALMYNEHFHEPELVQQVLYQEKLMRIHTKDQNTGLFYHAWDEKKQQPWANPETGCSPEFWSRSIGWYGTALIDIAERLPDYHPSRTELIEELRALIPALLAFQDEQTGLWYQVTHKGAREDNWLESSGTSLFIYTIAKAVQNGWADASYLKEAERAFNGLMEHMVDISGGEWKLNGICIGTSAGVYDYYVSRPASANDLHGVGAFLLAVVALEQAKK
ncbi:glycoside hydrolase family 88 protein [Domibacillus sp.]|uniref:glycoside hydrolase family 88/105 protein n=1 Tax=Domibacillus sp. TaxID=1969783 RepID=UPI0028116618|nr:glycoside hydrolase family 88 protein [Domibacillus sp.]